MLRIGLGKLSKVPILPQVMGNRLHVVGGYEVNSGSEGIHLDPCISPDTMYTSNCHTKNTTIDSV